MRSLVHSLNTNKCFVCLTSALAAARLSFSRHIKYRSNYWFCNFGLNSDNMSGKKPFQTTLLARLEYYEEIVNDV